MTDESSASEPLLSHELDRTLCWTVGLLFVGMLGAAVIPHIIYALRSRVRAPAKLWYLGLAALLCIDRAILMITLPDRWLSPMGTVVLYFLGSTIFYSMFLALTMEWTMVLNVAVHETSRTFLLSEFKKILVALIIGNVVLHVVEYVILALMSVSQTSNLGWDLQLSLHAILSLIIVLFFALWSWRVHRDLLRTWTQDRDRDDLHRAGLLKWTSIYCLVVFLVRGGIDLYTVITDKSLITSGSLDVTMSIFLVLCELVPLLLALIGMYLCKGLDAEGPSLQLRRAEANPILSPGSLISDFPKQLRGGGATVPPLSVKVGGDNGTPLSPDSTCGEDDSSDVEAPSHPHTHAVERGSPASPFVMGQSGEGSVLPGGDGSGSINVSGGGGRRAAVSSQPHSLQCCTVSTNGDYVQGRVFLPPPPLASLSDSPHRDRGGIAVPRPSRSSASLSSHSSSHSSPQGGGGGGSECGGGGVSVPVHTHPQPHTPASEAQSLPRTRSRKEARERSRGPLTVSRATTGAAAKTQVQVQVGGFSGAFVVVSGDEGRMRARLESRLQDPNRKGSAAAVESRGGLTAEKGEEERQP